MYEYVNGVHEITLGREPRDDSELLSDLLSRFCIAYAHSVFCKYSKDKYPGLIKHDIWCWVPNDAPIAFQRCLDYRVDRYIVRSLPSIKRWIQHQRLEAMKICFFNKESKIVLCHKIELFESVGGGMARRLHDFQNRFPALRLHLGGLLKEFELSDPFEVTDGELHEFKIIFRFQERIRNNKRHNEHRWIKAKRYKPISKLPNLLDSWGPMPKESDKIMKLQLQAQRYLPYPEGYNPLKRKYHNLLDESVAIIE